MRADAPLQLDEFRDQLKIHIGEISEKVVELCTVVEGAKICFLEFVFKNMKLQKTLVK